MQLSKESVNVLKNFSTINPSILFLEGNTQRTITPGKALIYAEAVLEEEFPREFAIHDLSNFLGVLSLFDDPSLEFDASRVIVKDEHKMATFRFSHAESISHPPKDKSVKPGNVLGTFTLTKDMLKTLQTGASIYTQSHIVIDSDGEDVYIRTLNIHDRESDSVSIHLGESPEKMRLVVSLDNLKIMSHSYDLSVTDRRILVFKSTDMNLTYVIPSEEKHSSVG